MESIQPIQTKEEIARSLRTAIFSGELENSQELTQEQVAVQLSVSRMPVREALQQLAQEGVVERLPNRHIRVVGVSPRRVEQSFRTLCAMEQELCRLRQEAKLSGAALLELLTRLETEESAREQANLEYAFHELLSRELDNPPLHQTHRQMLSGFFRYTLEHTHRPRGKIIVQLSSCLDVAGAQDPGRWLPEYYKQLSLAAVLEVMEHCQA